MLLLVSGAIATAADPEAVVAVSVVVPGGFDSPGLAVWVSILIRYFCDMVVSPADVLAKLKIRRRSYNKFNSKAGTVGPSYIFQAT